MPNTPPLHEVKAMLKAFMDSKTTTSIDFRKVSQLVEVAIEEHERMLDLIRKVMETTTSEILYNDAKEILKALNK